MKYRLAIFDFDGTLADTAGWMRRALDELADTHGLRKVSDEDVERLRGSEPRAIMSYLGVKPWKLPVIAKDVRTMMARDLDRIRLFPGATDLLASLHARGIQIAIVTSNAEENVRRILGASAVHVTHYACGASLFGKRPKLRAVLRTSGVAPAEALAIGDEVRDIDAAKPEGIATAAVTWGYSSADILRARSPTYVVNELSALLDCF